MAGWQGALPAAQDDPPARSYEGGGAVPCCCPFGGVKMSKNKTPLWADKVPVDLLRHPLVSATPRPGMSRRLMGGGYGWDEGSSVTFTLAELDAMPTMHE